MVLSDTPATLHACEACETLQYPNPHWLDRAYAKVWTPDPDTGALMRANAVHRIIRRMRASGMLPRKHSALDFGSGPGTLVRLLRDEGKNAYGYEPYRDPFFAEEFCSRELRPGPFDLVIATEVLEHTTDPVPFLEKLKGLALPHGLILLSTELFDPTEQQDLSAWPYLSLECGQHVTLFTPKGLDQAATRAGLVRFMSLSFAGSASIHLLARPETAPGVLARSSLRLRHTLGERRQRRDSRI